MYRLLQSRSRGSLLAVHCIVATVFLSHSVYALDPSRQLTQYIQSNWSSDAGLPQNSVHAIAQTKDGYLWLGTEEGLARFDGVRFQIFRRETNNGLASDYIRALFAAGDGTLWIGTDSGLSYLPFVGAPESSVQPSLPIKLDAFSGDSIIAICEDRDGAIWVASNHGLRRIVHSAVEDWSAKPGLPAAAVTAIALDTQGTLWVGTGRGLSYLQGGHFLTLTKRDGLPASAVSALAGSRDGSLWVALQDRGIVQIRNGHAIAPPQHLPWNEVYSLLVDQDGSLWITFNRHGVGRLSRGHLDLYETANGLSSDRCTRGLFEDREGTLWIGTLDAGVIQLRDGKFAVFGTPEGLSGNYVGNVFQARNGDMWIGADSSGINHILPNGRVEVWDQHKGLPDSAVYSLLQTRDGSIWAGYREGILARIRDGKVSLFRNRNADGNSINALFQDREGHLWVGFFGDGLAQFDRGAIHFITHGERVVDIEQSSDGALWVATDGDGVEKLVQGVVVKRFTLSNGLPSDHAMCIFTGDDGNIWVGTANGGLSRIHRDQIVSWTTKQGLPAATVGTIIADHSGHLWMGSDEGIFRISMHELYETAGKPSARLHPAVYDSSNGLRSRETLFGSTQSSRMDQQGRLWFATTKGAAVIDPEHMPLDKVPEPVWIENVTFDSVPVPLTQDIKLGPGAGNLQINFTSPSFIAPLKTHFRYRLFGFDPDWTDADSRRSVRYTNLPPGKYTFRVQAENGDAVRNNTGASFQFVLRRPLSQTPLAILIYAMLCILTVWALISIRTRRLLSSRQVLENIVAERTAQLEAEKSALEKARRELHIQATHDVLTGLYNRRAMIDHIDREMSRAVRSGTTLGLLIADLDHFKLINDQLGHISGDDIIRESGQRFQEAVRGYDIVGRYGGEEFLILCPDFDIQNHPQRIDALLDAIRSKPFIIESAEVQVTCSIGVGTFRPAVDKFDARAALKRADVALYEAKNAGRNCVRFESRNDVEDAVEADT